MENVEHPDIRNMDPATREQAQRNVAMTSKEHMIEWLEATKRRWLVLNSIDMVNALPYPHGKT